MRDKAVTDTLDSKKPSVEVNEKKDPSGEQKKGIGSKIFWGLIVCAFGVFLYTANEGQDNMFEDMAEMFGNAKGKATALFKASPVANAENIIRSNLKDPNSFKRQKSVLIWTGQKKTGEPAHIVLLDYTAQNSFGGAVRGCHVVSFYETASDKVKWNPNSGVQKLQRSTCQATLSDMQKSELSRLMRGANGFTAN